MAQLQQISLEWTLNGPQLSRIMVFRIIMGVGVLFGSFQAAAKPRRLTLGSQLSILTNNSKSQDFASDFGES